MASSVMGKTPLTALISPLRETSPIKQLSFISFVTIFVALRIATSIPRSCTEPVFFVSAGARFTITLCGGNSMS